MAAGINPEAAAHRIFARLPGLEIWKSNLALKLKFKTNNNEIYETKNNHQN
jgi:hypothetical protein